MPPIFTAKEICRRLKKIWFVQDRQTGSHAVFEKELDNEMITVIVPMHNWDCRVWTFMNILKQARITLDEWNQI